MLVNDREARRGGGPRRVSRNCAGMLTGARSLSTPSPGASPDLPTNLRPGKVGPGAVELVGRYKPLNIGHQVFTGGLADPNLWTKTSSTRPTWA